MTRSARTTEAPRITAARRAPRGPGGRNTRRLQAHAGQSRHNMRIARMACTALVPSTRHFVSAPPYARRHGKGVRPARKAAPELSPRISGRNSAAVLPAKPPIPSQQIPFHANHPESTRSHAVFPCVVPCRRKPLPRRRRKDGHGVAGGAEGRGARARSWRRGHPSRRPRAARRLSPAVSVVKETHRWQLAPFVLRFMR